MKVGEVLILQKRMGFTTKKKEKKEVRKWDLGEQ